MSLLFEGPSLLADTDHETQALPTDPEVLEGAKAAARAQILKELHDPEFGKVISLYAQANANVRTRTIKLRSQILAATYQAFERQALDPDEKAAQIDIRRQLAEQPAESGLAEFAGAVEALRLDDFSDEDIHGAFTEGAQSDPSFEQSAELSRLLLYPDTGADPAHEPRYMF